MQTANEPLTPAAGGINCIVAERRVSQSADVASNGAASRIAWQQLFAEVGAAVIQLAMEEPRGTLEIQFTCARIDNAKTGIDTHQWRVDLWKARQRQYLRVPVRRLSPNEIFSPGAKMPDVDLKANGHVPMYKGQRLGEFACTHCNLPHSLAPFTHGNLPRKLTLNCSRCTLPIHVQLVDCAQKE